MVFICVCGKRYRAPDGTVAENRRCPACGGDLRAVDVIVPSDPVLVHIEQKKALRDELRGRDRQLRRAQQEIARLKADNDRLRAELDRARGGKAPLISDAPVVVNRSTDWKPQELPSERLDLALSPVLEDLPDLSDAPQLPSDRLPLYPQESSQ